MQRRKVATLMVLVMLLGIFTSGCGKKEELAEYTPVSHELYTMPDSLETVEDHRQAWKSVMSYVFDGGATFYGEQFPAMSVAYLEQAAKEHGYSISSTDRKVEFSGEGFTIKAELEDILNSRKGMIGSVDLRVIHKDAQIAPETLEEIRSVIKIGNATLTLGCTTEEMLAAFGITPELFNALREQPGEYIAWYENRDSFWYVSFSESRSEYSGSLQHLIHLSRTENSHDQDIYIFATNKCVDTIYYDDIMAEHRQDQLAENARNWEAGQDLIGSWRLPDQSGRIVFYEDETGLLSVPGVTSSISSFNWRCLRIEDTGDGERILFQLEILESKKIVAQWELRYNEADRSITLTDADKTFSFTFSKDS